MRNDIKNPFDYEQGNIKLNKQSSQLATSSLSCIIPLVTGLSQKSIEFSRSFKMQMNMISYSIISLLENEDSLDQLVESPKVLLKNPFQSSLNIQHGNVSTYQDSDDSFGLLSENTDQ
ncbi:hypothetical protein SS50377_27610 [Spironucleus salmonicida]|uniref:Uncharacterized protein n=1 Tax=Spironucleus salmonicida TaxID=348837 RepID=V6LSD1_9EUKA|nr:hypothetical protein SS50377_27610 [Spironucleus salmonicida]|eukprot:EST46611.1 Hypothetical protein SS50377_13416 [Spironucleus salmonicida]